MKRRAGHLAARIAAAALAPAVAASALAQSASTQQAPEVMTRVFSVTGSASDRHVWRLESGGKVTPVRAETNGQEVVVARTSISRRLLVSVGLLRFRTAAIPDDARITAVRLQFEITFGGSEDRLRLVVEPYPPGRWPIDSRDFVTRPRVAPVGSFDLGSLHGGKTADIRLDPRTVRPRGSLTALRLVIPGRQTDDTNAVHFASVDHRRLAAPRLVVTYSTGDAPAQPPHPR